MLLWTIAAAAAEVPAPPTANSTVQVWLAIIAVVAPMTAIIAPLIAGHSKHKSGMNAPRPTTTTTPGPELTSAAKEEAAAAGPKPPVVKADGQIDAAASVMQMYETMMAVHTRQQKSESENNELRREVFQLSTKIEYLERHHKTAMQQLLTWAVNLSGNPPHQIPAWVSELTNIARER